jgi:hypothetical protein
MRDQPWSAEKMLSDVQEAAIQRAFRDGQEAYREGKAASENRYPPTAESYFAAWQQGYECEHEVIHA